MSTTVLLVEDELALQDSLKQEFQFEDFGVLTATTGLEAVATFQEHAGEVDLIVLDWMLPELDGLGVLRRIRRTSNVPVLMLTAKDYVGDKVAGLNGGADDYVTKPFDTEELLARMHALIRGRQALTPVKDEFQLDTLTLDIHNRQVTRAGLIVVLTQREFQLLAELFRNQGVTCTRDDLLNAVWGIDFEGQPNIVDVYIRYLRNKLDTDGSQRLIHTVRGVGYVLSNNFA